MISLKGSLQSYTTRPAEISAPAPSELTIRHCANAKTLLFGENSAILWLGAGTESRRCYRFCECDFNSGPERLRRSVAIVNSEQCDAGLISNRRPACRGLVEIVKTTGTIPALMKKLTHQIFLIRPAGASTPTTAVIALMTEAGLFLQLITGLRKMTVGRRHQ